MSAHRAASYMNLNEKQAKELLKTRVAILEVLASGAPDPDNFKMSEEEFLSKLIAGLNTTFREAAMGIFNCEFDSIDVDGDGVISPKEHKAFFYGWGIPTEYSEDVFKVMDTDGDGFINREEFIEAHADFMFSEDENSRYNDFFGSLD
ncbi:sarcoplasmic calcium-binding protein-like [Lingula anatina]|uniref:Sarcoplasmic calcium-binding protein-like n=1 Tax=Lingula anatina TaxID=7574 RepID=A0A1S3H4C3_LINAN|nr:sarcoplasmic calcium-binding protein-like [Lingula anatina]|eukprot:XP_013380812.1 sarcoplasmic calcium-binding protein-like [Lingula anatina]